QERDPRDRPGAADLLELAAGRDLLRDLAALLQVDQVRVGGPAAGVVHDRRSRPPAGVRRGALSLLVEAIAGARPRRAAAHPLFVALAQQRVHLGVPPQLLLARQGGPQPPGPAAPVLEQAQERRVALLAGRIPHPRRTGDLGFALLAVLVRGQPARQDRL